MRRGFTLVELVLVLLVIALTTHLAVHEVSRIRDAKLVSAANRQLEDIRSAALGFLADTGRFVMATNGTLSELWERPADVAEYRVLQASAANIVAGADAGLADPSVRVPTGWRGPYLRLPIGRSRLLDPWGNPIESVDAAGLSRIGVTNEVYAASVSHYGPKGQREDERVVSLLPGRGDTCSLTVWATGEGIADEVTLAWYGPAEGAITGAVAHVAANVQHRFEGLTPGERIVTVKVGVAAPVVRLVMVRPGDNLLEVKMQ